MHEFFNGIFVGISQTIIGHPLDTIKTNVQNGIKLTKYSPLKLYKGVLYPTMSSSIINGLMFYTSKTINNYTNNYFVSGYITGVITSPIINIFELYKVRRQIGKPVKKIFLRPFIGLSPTLIRESFAMSLYFGTYHTLRENDYDIFLSGAISGSLSWLLTYPLDVIKTRFQSGNFINWKNAIQHGNLWKGITPCLVRSFIVNGVSFKIYEHIK